MDVIFIMKYIFQAVFEQTEERPTHKKFICCGTKFDSITQYGAELEVIDNFNRDLIDRRWVGIERERKATPPPPSYQPFLPHVSAAQILEKTGA